MPVFQTKRYEQILAQMIAKVVTRSKLSDISDSAMAKHILAAAARQDDEQYFQMSLLLSLFSIDTATGDDLNERAKEIQPGTVYRREAQKSAGNLVFSRTGAIGTVAIPERTRCKTSGGLIFVTTAAGSILAGNTDSGLIPAIAEEAGANGNVATGTIVKFASKPSGVNSVTNPSAFSYGTDKESDDSFRNRLKNFIASLPRSTVQALESGVLGAQDPNTGAIILFSKAVEDAVNRGYVIVYVDDGTGSAESTEAISGEKVTEGLGGGGGDAAVGGEEVLRLNYGVVKDSIPAVITSSTRGVLTGGFEFDSGYDYWINPASGQINFDPALTNGEEIDAGYTRYTGLIALAQRIIDGDPNDRATYPGIRAAGVLVQAKTPQVQVQNISVAVTISEGYDNNEVKTGVKEVIKEYVNALGISGDVLRATLIRRIMGVSGVYNCVVNTPAVDVILLDDQMARTTDPNIVVS